MKSQPIPQRWFYWSCIDDCKYSCMWDTVEAFNKDGSPVPQFYGKVGKGSCINTSASIKIDSWISLSVLKSGQ